MMRDLTGRLCALTAAIWTLSCVAAAAQPTTIVVPYAAGGPTDVVARLLADRMGRTLGQTIIVENVAGAGGTIGPARVARSTPDGSTILIHHISLLAAPGLYSNLSYDTRTAFEPVGLVNTGPMVLVGRKTLAPADGAALIPWLKQNGDKVNFAHAGNGTSQHFCTVQLGNVVGFRPSFVSYRGAAPAMNDLVAGQIDMICDQSSNAIPQVQSGTVRAYAVTSKTRLDSIKDVPTMAEVGLPEVDYAVWHGLYVPKGTPPATVEKLNAALRKALDDPLVIERFKELGTTPFPADRRSPAAHATLFSTEFDRLAKLIESAGLKATTAN
ncbi:MAG: tripartite tricarboxylate transporter substrate binding protein BugD [Rhodoplanes sp.]|uniref:tripartite tricarboxylate transporter substrate-binding protein n=1 Tax=Rhodoplanes sp. TaxID=1968906 RepID=UPI0017AC7FFE|nr:tripartite tricarboxylate transporter substrate-binding protein [Rhodoplanes sp.]NVO14795.1 tripartite tricarboxylate transporter substrate binding protein BugD [Rhodoplanes sp.]